MKKAIVTITLLLVAAASAHPLGGASVAYRESMNSLLFAMFLGIGIAYP